MGRYLVQYQDYSEWQDVLTEEGTELTYETREEAQAECNRRETDTEYYRVLDLYAREVLIRDRGDSYVVEVEGREYGEYRYSSQDAAGREAEREQMRTSVQEHLDNGGTAGSYQW